MFRYMSNGPRNYADSPISLRRRSTWEFMAVLKGRIAPLLPLRPQVPVALTLWAFPPWAEHGWVGVPRQPAEVIVLHPLQIPSMLDQAAKAANNDGKYLSVSLSVKDVAWLRKIFASAQSASNYPDCIAGLRLDRIVLDLAIFVLSRVPQRWLPIPRDTSEAMVVRALAWMGDHLEERIGVTGAARAVGCSPAHLRRLFHAMRGVSPRDALSDLRLRRADQLLADPSLVLADVAQQCGYADAAALCRTYRARRGTSPRGMPRVGNPTPRFRDIIGNTQCRLHP